MSSEGGKEPWQLGVHAPLKGQTALGPAVHCHVKMGASASSSASLQRAMGNFDFYLLASSQKFG